MSITMLPKWCSPKQYKEITGSRYPSTSPVWYRATRDGGGKVEPHWELAMHIEVELLDNIVIANNDGPPPTNWRIR